MGVAWKLRGSVFFHTQSVIANMQRPPPPEMEMGPALNTRLEKRRRVGIMFATALRVTDLLEVLKENASVGGQWMNALSMVNRTLYQSVGGVFRTAVYPIQALFFGNLERARLANFREMQEGAGGVVEVPDIMYSLWRRWPEAGPVNPYVRDRRMMDWDNSRIRRLNN